jgi:hypothetical protein
VSSIDDLSAVGGKEPERPSAVGASPDGTVVPPAPDPPPAAVDSTDPETAPTRSRTQVWVGVVLVVVLGASLTVALISGSGRGAGVFEGHGVRFDFPKIWSHESNVEALQSPFAGATTYQWIEGFAVTDTGNDVVLVAALKPSSRIGDFGSTDDYLDFLVQVDRVHAPQGYRVISAERARLGEDVADLPGLRLVMAPQDPTDHTIARLTMGLNSQSEYLVLCLYEPQAQAQLLAGCDQIVSTFSVG